MYVHVYYGARETRVKDRVEMHAKMYSNMYSHLEESMQVSQTLSLWLYIISQRWVGVSNVRPDSCVCMWGSAVLTSRYSNRSTPTITKTVLPSNQPCTHCSGWGTSGRGHCNGCGPSRWYAVERLKRIVGKCVSSHKGIKSSSMTTWHSP